MRARFGQSQLVIVYFSFSRPCFSFLEKSVFPIYLFFFIFYYFFFRAAESVYLSLFNQNCAFRKRRKSVMFPWEIGVT